MLAAAMLQGHCSPRPCRSVWASVHSRVRPGPRAGRGMHSCVLPDPLRLLAPCGLYRRLRSLGAEAVHLANRDEQAAALHDSADSALNLKWTFTLCDAGKPGHTSASQHEHSQLSSKSHGAGGGDGGGRSPALLTWTLSFCPKVQWSQLLNRSLWHEKYSVPGCVSTAR